MGKPTFVTHKDPVWIARANYIIQVDLSEHGMAAGTYEQFWTRSKGDDAYEVCCLPYFTYGIALGDEIRWNDDDRHAEVLVPSSRRLIRSVFTEKEDAKQAHESFHGALLEVGALVEFSDIGYASIDVDSDTRLDAVLSVLTPFHAAGRLSWEWASPAE